jgi:Ca2+-binding RTX toxin-like protein
VVQDAAAGVPVTINGGAGRNSLVGPDSANIWHISGGDAGTLSGTSLGSPVRFTSIQNLTGGADADTFVFDDGATLSGSIDGGGGINALDYAAYTTDVAVILPNHSATSVGGGVFHIRDVSGRGPGSNILVGDGGNNTLRGGGGRDLLIAGAGPGMLFGGDGEDILIGGSTAYDTDAVALRAIMDEWLRTDLSYEERVDHLMNGGGLNGPYLLNSSTVSGNGGGNTLKGESGRDWFFGNLMRDENDWDALTELFLSI